MLQHTKAYRPEGAPPIAFTIAGSDSGGGAGIQADLKTFSALGVYGASAITAVTAQNTRAVTAVHEMQPEIVAAQVEAVFGDLAVGAVKIGMLSSPAIIEAVADALAILRTATRRLAARRTDSPLAMSLAPAFAMRWLLPRFTRFQGYLGERLEL